MASDGLRRVVTTDGEGGRQIGAYATDLGPSEATKEVQMLLEQGRPESEMSREEIGEFAGNVLSVLKTKISAEQDPKQLVDLANAPVSTEGHAPSQIQETIRSRATLLAMVRLLAMPPDYRQDELQPEVFNLVRQRMTELLTPGTPFAIARSTRSWQIGLTGSDVLQAPISQLESHYGDGSLVIDLPMARYDDEPQAPRRVELFRINGDARHRENEGVPTISVGRQEMQRFYFGGSLGSGERAKPIFPSGEDPKQLEEWKQAVLSDEPGYSYGGPQVPGDMAQALAESDVFIGAVMDRDVAARVTALREVVEAAVWQRLVGKSNRTSYTYDGFNDLGLLRPLYETRAQAYAKAVELTAAAVRHFQKNKVRDDFGAHDTQSRVIDRALPALIALRFGRWHNDQNYVAIGNRVTSELFAEMVRQDEADGIDLQRLLGYVATPKQDS